MDGISIVTQVIGKIVWGVKRTHGSMFLWESGEPHLRIRDPVQSQSTDKKVVEILIRRRVTLYGDFTFLFENVNWFLFDNGYEVCNSGSDTDLIDERLDLLDGQIIVKAYYDESCDFVFEFDLGTRLIVSRNEDQVELWTLYKKNSWTAVFNANKSVAVS